VQQNLISGIKIPLTVKFKKIQINECYQFYNHTPTDTSIYVKTKFDPTWSSVVSVEEIIGLLRQSLTNLEDILDAFTGAGSEISQLQSINTQLDDAYAKVLKANNFTDDGKNAIRGKIAQIKAENQKMIDNPSICNVGSSANGRVRTDACPVPQNKTNINDLFTFLGDDSKLQCALTRRLNGMYIRWKQELTQFENQTKGETVNLMIDTYYFRKTTGQRRAFEYAIPKSSVKGNTGYADIVNFDTGDIFEIKPETEETAGDKQVKKYIDNAIKYCSSIASWKRGASVFPIGKANAVTYNFNIDGKTKKFKFWLSTQYQGVVLYTFENSNNENEELLPQEVIKIILSLALLNSDKIKKMNDITKMEEYKKEIYQDVMTKFKKIDTDVLVKIAITAVGTGAAFALSTAIPGNQFTGTTATIFMGIVGIVAVEELSYRGVFDYN
jgi:hypothetical protein